MKILKNIKRLMNIIGKSATLTHKTLDHYGDSCIIGGVLLDLGMTESEIRSMGTTYGGFNNRARELLADEFNIDDNHCAQLMSINDTSPGGVATRRHYLEQYVKEHGDTFEEELQNCVSDTNRLKEPEEISALCGVEA